MSHTPSAQDLAATISQLHQLHQHRADLLPSPEIERFHSLVCNIITFIDSAQSRKELFSRVLQLEKALDIAQKNSKHTPTVSVPVVNQNNTDTPKETKHHNPNCLLGNGQCQQTCLMCDPNGPSPEQIAQALAQL